MSSDPEDGEGDQGQGGTTNQNAGGGGRQSGGDDRRGGGQSERRRETSTAQKVIMAISVAVTVLLFAYAGWHIVTPPQGDTPQLSVVDTAPLQNGDVAVTVRLRNPKDIGLITATVESNCSSPPAEVQFSYIPASSTETGTLVCPAGTTEPSVSIANWVRR